MVHRAKHKGKEIYLCDACGFGYLSKSLAAKCEKHCNTKHSCSLEITQHAVKKG